MSLYDLRKPVLVIGDFKGGLGAQASPVKKWVVENLKENIEVYIGVVKPSIFNTLTCHF